MNGLGYRTVGRLTLYERALGKLAKVSLDKLESEYTEREAADLILIFPEILEFLEVAGSLSAYPHLLKHPRFKEIASGQLLTTTEGNTTPRDTLFELTTAALVARAGLDVAVDGLSDIEAMLGQSPLLIECKRIQNFDGLERRLGDANRQLGERKAKRGKAAIGLAAISITKAITGGEKKLHVKNKDEMDAAMNELLRLGKVGCDVFWSRFLNYDGVLLQACVSGTMNGPLVNTQLHVLPHPYLSKECTGQLATLLGRLMRSAL